MNLSLLAPEIQARVLAEGADLTGGTRPARTTAVIGFRILLQPQDHG